MLNISKDALYIINKLHNNQYQAYFVGGSIRDLLLGISPTDYDIATNATPDEIKEVFSEYFYLTVGEKFGTISVRYRKKFYEITTFRKDVGYINHRKPKEVIFSQSIYDDLSRRDFTINAFAYNHKEGLIDYFEGLNDLENKQIKAVGNPDDRFKEDALRILRGIRFALSLEFNIEEKTLDAMIKNSQYINNLSYERIRDEFTIILRYLNYHYWLKYDLIFKVFIPEISSYSNEDYNYLFNAFPYLNNDLALKLTFLLFKVDNPDDILRRLKFSKQIIKEVLLLIENFNIRIQPNKTNIKYNLKENHENFDKILIMHYAKAKVENDINYLEDLKKINDHYQEIIKSKEPFLISHLNIDGTDLIKLGVKKGPKVKERLDELLDYVISNPNANNYNSLVDYLYNKLN